MVSLIWDYYLLLDAIILLLSEAKPAFPAELGNNFAEAKKRQPKLKNTYNYQLIASSTEIRSINGVFQEAILVSNDLLWHINFLHELQVTRKS